MSARDEMIDHLDKVIDYDNRKGEIITKLKSKVHYTETLLIPVRTEGDLVTCDCLCGSKYTTTISGFSGRYGKSCGCLTYKKHSYKGQVVWKAVTTHRRIVFNRKKEDVDMEPAFYNLAMFLSFYIYASPSLSSSMIRIDGTGSDYTIDNLTFRG